MADSNLNFYISGISSFTTDLFALLDQMIEERKENEPKGVVIVQQKDKPPFIAEE
jgi:hypothetical protein